MLNFSFFQRWVKTLGIFFFMVIISSPLRALNPTWSKSVAPSKKQWGWFLRLSDRERGTLLEKSSQLSDWAWEWRVAWVRVCLDNQAYYCSRVLTSALADEAMVVRAQAASALGYDKDKRRATRLLKKAFANPMNYRNNKPLWVQKRILESLHRIGGQASIVAGVLADQHDMTKEYWKKISKF